MSIVPRLRPHDPGVLRVAGGVGTDGGGPDHLTDLDAECLRIIRSRLGVGAFDLPPRLRPSLMKLERLRLIKYHGGRWWPTRPPDTSSEWSGLAGGAPQP